MFVPSIHWNISRRAEWYQRSSQRAKNVVTDWAKPSTKVQKSKHKFKDIINVNGNECVATFIYCKAPALCQKINLKKWKKTEILWSVSEPQFETQSLSTSPFPSLDNTSLSTSPFPSLDNTVAQHKSLSFS